MTLSFSLFPFFFSCSVCFPLSLSLSLFLFFPLSPSPSLSPSRVGLPMVVFGSSRCAELTTSPLCTVHVDSSISDRLKVTIRKS